MAVMDAVFSFTDVAPTTATLATGASSAEIELGAGSLWAYVADTVSYIRFGVTGMGAASASYFRIPANTMLTISMNRNLTHIRIFNNSGGNCIYHIVPLYRS